MDSVALMTLTTLCNLNAIHFQNLSLIPNSNCPFNKTPHFSLPQPPFFSVSVNLPTRRTHGRGITECVSCCICLMALSIISSGSHHVGAPVWIPFLLRLKDTPSQACPPYYPFICPDAWVVSTLWLLWITLLWTPVRLFESLLQCFRVWTCTGRADHMAILL